MNPIPINEHASFSINAGSNNDLFGFFVVNPDEIGGTYKDDGSVHIESNNITGFCIGNKKLFRALYDLRQLLIEGGKLEGKKVHLSLSLEEKVVDEAK